jgi:hypothetical protein
MHLFDQALGILILLTLGIIKTVKKGWVKDMSHGSVLVMRVSHNMFFGLRKQAGPDQSSGSSMIRDPDCSGLSLPVFFLFGPIMKNVTFSRRTVGSQRIGIKVQDESLFANIPYFAGSKPYMGFFRAA